MPARKATPAPAPSNRKRVTAPSAKKATRGSAVADSLVPPRGPGRARSDESRISILNASLRLLETQSLQQISIESIAREAGVGKATIYRWWSSKASVVIDAFMQNHLLHTPMPSGGSARAAITQHLHLLVEQYAGWPGRLVAQIIGEGQSDPAVMREFQERFWYGRRAVVREIVEGARSRGEFRSDMEAELQIEMLYSPIYMRLIMGHLPLNKRFADMLASQVLPLLCTEAEAPAPAAASRRRRA